MGVSYRFFTFIGVEVPEDFVWETTHHTEMMGRDCGHPGEGRFCATCGLPRPYERTIPAMRVRPELGIDEDDIANGRIVPGLPDGIAVHYFDNNLGDSLLLAGWLLSDADRDDGFHEVYEVPAIDRERLQAVLKEHAIPFDASSWGVHLVVTAN